jgi:nucleotide-binding universal stress UspA family protein
MVKLLVSVDGSECSDRVLDYVVKMGMDDEPIDVHLLSVQIPIDSGHARMFVSGDDVENYHRDEGEAVLKPYLDKLDAAGITYTYHVLVGHVAPTIARFAKEQEFDKVVIGTRGRSGVARLLLGSVAQKVERLSEIPVLLIK